MSLKDAAGFEDYEERNRDKLQTGWFEKNDLRTWDFAMWMIEHDPTTVDEYLNEVHDGIAESYWKYAHEQYCNREPIDYEPEGSQDNKPHE